jgi:hypothetical protein
MGDTNTTTTSAEPVPVYQSLYDYYFFSAFDLNGNLQYTKYNFNFQLYKDDFITEIIDAYQQSEPIDSEVFHHFLIKNQSNLYKAFTVKNELTKYFNTITPETTAYINKYGFSFKVNYQYIVAPPTDNTEYETFENQFELVEYSTNDVRRLQDYICYTATKMYTKYNFDFELYKKDFNIHFTNKLPIFTDYLVRNQYLNGSVVPGFGVGYPAPAFEKYFIQTMKNASGNTVSNYNFLQNYLITNSVTSIYTRVTNSFPNIDWNAYVTSNRDLNYRTMTQFREHFLVNGQFEQRTVPFGDNNYNETLQSKINSIIKVSSDDNQGTGFLFNGGVNSGINGVSQLYLVTCYHLIRDSPNQNTIFASVNYIDVSKADPEQVCRQLQFKIIGYDIFSDVLVGLYDENLDYNKAYNSNLDISKTPTLSIDGMSYIRKNEEVYTIGNIGTFDSNTILSGKLMNNAYNCDYNSTFYLGSPGSFLIQFNSEKGLSGSPIFKKNTNECIGMINGSVGENGKYTVSISNFYLSAIVNNSISRWFTYGPRYEELKDYSSLSFFTGDSFPKKWFGVLCKYYNPLINYKWKSLNSLNYNSGLLVYDFVLGFNKTTNKFITNPSDLNKTNVMKIDTFLLKTKMYQKFIENSRNPIVIKSVLGFQNIESDYDKFSFGLDNNQYGYRTITYNTSQIKTIANAPGFTNATLRVYPLLTITYFYFDGIKWIETSEIVGGDTDEWYNVYENDSGKKMKQHNIEFPLTLIPFTRSYIFGIGNVQSQNKTLIPSVDESITDDPLLNNRSRLPPV